MFPTADSVRQEAQEWLTQLPKWNRRKWHAQPISIELSSDASDFGYGGKLHLPAGQSMPVSGNLTESEVRESSTTREAVAFREAYRVGL